MPNHTNTSGQILTLYSFKGGVGRTMALANMAFLAAQSGLKVLMMDWDLEAPGLEYYFRAMRAPSTGGQKQTPGILDILWRWRAEIQTRPDDGITALAMEYRSGKPFSDCIRPVVDATLLPKDARLDFIGSGSSRITTPELLPYGEALAKFSWTSFFEDEAGGIVIDSLRDWSKSNYDIIFVDSRTGLSDVAGLCTMQLPDQVAICFILNRQNIDGAAQVAAAIKASRKSEVRIRTVPMRVATRQTSEESDARARAASELCDVGTLEKEQVESDLRSLAVPQSDNVPFYEALAPFMGTSVTYDPLTLHYSRLASELTGHKLPVLELEEDVIALVRGRLQPKTATIDYLRELSIAEPTRATEELRSLLSAADQAREYGLPPSEAYVRALIEAVFSIDGIHRGLDDTDLQLQAIDLSRHLHASNPVKWAGVYLLALEQYIATADFWLVDQDELELLLELKTLLNSLPSAQANQKKIHTLRMIARHQSRAANYDEALQALRELALNIHDIRREEAPQTDLLAEDLRVAELDLWLLQGDVASAMGNDELAYESYQHALDQSRDTHRQNADSEVKHLIAQVYQRFALNPELVKRSPADHAGSAFHAMQVLKWSSRAWFASLIPLTRVVVAYGNEAQLTEICIQVFSLEQRNQLRRKVTELGRAPKQTIEYLQQLRVLVRLVSSSNDRPPHQLLIPMADSATQLLRSYFRRLPSSRNPRSESVDEAAAQLQLELSTAGMDWQPPPRGTQEVTTPSEEEMNTVVKPRGPLQT